MPPVQPVDPPHLDPKSVAAKPTLWQKIKNLFKKLLA